MRHPYFDLPKPIILGHRGAAGDAPENTLVGFRKGLELGAHIIESDVHLTSDGVAVLAHDPEVDRITEGSGHIADRSLAELKALDAGHRYSPDDGAGHPYRGQGISIPTLEEAFAALPEARFNLEIKAERAELCEQVIELIRAHDRADRTLVTAGDDPVMKLLREARTRGLAEGELPPAIGASLGDILAVVRSAQSGEAPDTDSMALQIPSSFGGDPLVTDALVSHCHAHGIEVHVWTINAPDEIRALLDLGVDGIVTDYPGRMAALLAERG